MKSLHIVLSAILAVLASAVPGLSQSTGMSFSVYNDASGSWTNGGTITAYSSVEDLSWGCSHSSYSTTTRLISPSGRQSGSTVSGLSASTSLALNGEEGDWQIVTQGSYHCSCFQSFASFGAGHSMLVNTFTSRSCWGPWQGELDTDGFGHQRCVYRLSNNNPPDCASCVGDPAGPFPPKVHRSDFAAGNCPNYINWDVIFFKLYGHPICDGGMGTWDYTGDSCVCSDRGGWPPGVNGGSSSGNPLPTPTPTPPPPPPPCGANLSCYPSLRQCQEACCGGVCERRINCGSETAHKCFR
jgi:hypothetical protein